MMEEKSGVHRMKEGKEGRKDKGREERCVS